MIQATFFIFMIGSNALRTLEYFDLAMD